jgi:hypothetical protein
MERHNLQWVVICGETVAKKSTKLSDFPSEQELMKLGSDTDRIPFAYSKAHLPEQLPWADTSDGDSYPTLRLIIEGKHIIGDFDTGAYQTHVSDTIVNKGILDFVLSNDEGLHLGSSYRFFTKRVEVKITTDEGITRTNGIPIAFVEDWEKSPFVKINRKRIALIGRDVLTGFQIQVVLDGNSKKTHVQG